MIELTHRAKEYGNAERLAEDFLKEYFHGKPIQYPINPFQILKDTGVIFLLQNWKESIFPLQGTMTILWLVSTPIGR